MRPAHPGSEQRPCEPEQWPALDLMQPLRSTRLSFHHDVARVLLRPALGYQAVYLGASASGVLRIDGAFLVHSERASQNLCRVLCAVKLDLADNLGANLHPVLGDVPLTLPELLNLRSNAPALRQLVVEAPFIVEQIPNIAKQLLR